MLPSCRLSVFINWDNREQFQSRIHTSYNLQFPQCCHSQNDVSYFDTKNLIHVFSQINIFFRFLLGFLFIFVDLLVNVFSWIYLVMLFHSSHQWMAPEKSTKLWREFLRLSLHCEWGHALLCPLSYCPYCPGTGSSHIQGFLTPRERAQLQARISSAALYHAWSPPGFFHPPQKVLLLQQPVANTMRNLLEPTDTLGQIWTLSYLLFFF